MSADIHVSHVLSWESDGHGNVEVSEFVDFVVKCIHQYAMQEVMNEAVTHILARADADIISTAVTVAIAHSEAMREASFVSPKLACRTLLQFTGFEWRGSSTERRHVRQAMFFDGA